MTQKKNYLLVREVAEICNLGHSTVTHWIRRKKVHAIESGNRYLVSKASLEQFLKLTGKSIPDALASENPDRPILPPLQSCWDYWRHQDHGKNCESCIVQRHWLSICFVAKQNDSLGCGTTCTQCDYYKDIYLPRYQFIHGFETPAVVFKDLVILGSNKQWELLCGLNKDSSAGMRFDQLFHPQSLVGVISDHNHRLLDEPVAPSRTIKLKNTNKGWGNSVIFIFTINSAEGTFLMLAESADQEKPIQKE